MREEKFDAEERRVPSLDVWHSDPQDQSQTYVLFMMLNFSTPNLNIDFFSQFKLKFGETISEEKT